MFYLFIINNIDLGKESLSTNEITEYLLEKELWAFTPTAPRIKSLKPLDEVIIYLAGKGNRCFVGQFTILTEPNMVERIDDEPDWLEMFPYRVKVGDTSIWAEPLSIKKVVNDLDFITDKKNYGLFFRQSVKMLTEKDYNTIISRRGQ